MALRAFKISFLCYSLFYFLIFYANIAAASFEIERGKYDTFRNLLCDQTSQSCTRDQCRSCKAECLDDQCVRCECREDGRNTFVTSGRNTGNCERDEDIIPNQPGKNE